LAQAESRSSGDRQYAPCDGGWGERNSVSHDSCLPKCAVRAAHYLRGVSGIEIRHFVRAADISLRGQIDNLRGSAIATMRNQVVFKRPSE
jgi:hypothetical protein